MPSFEYMCKECSVSWEIEEAIGKAPKTNDCPLCEKQVPRYYGNHVVGISFGDDGTGNKNNNAMDFQTNRSRYKKFAEKGYDKTAGDRFLKRSIKSTEKRIGDRESWGKSYKPMRINWENLARDGKARKLNDQETAEKIKRSDKLTRDAYNRAAKQGHDIKITDQNINKQS
jgi:predicted nucleic acid-binding Zn ribbon protein